ncbi:mechanosensitive ion channel [Psychrosphaera sp. B3R10]|uniref:Mechanosensitive ion channel n=1 Tax=Psychrosphaera algicola TaxID=3023714 RepID=A0ABT5FDU5_9GAMM|nr:MULTISPECIES: mechanosensitive ion channel domain-containing protein [unclassified Psychrosphaera]MBU2882447.1 mechanosensitive ion channel [Psychrosphaera sp. I2R16]MBU2990268.1 mechanosensitive ion channel [Psychrosphaera sp. B3R10]MDC2889279.1 mechanosensitive ion channel [Psychrosphaera sp. G1-22]
MDFQQTFSSIRDVLGTTIFTVSEQPITFGGLLMIPILIVLGLKLTKMLVRRVSQNLASKHTDPNVIHLMQRLFYVVAIAILVITILDILNVPITAFAFLSGAIAIGFGFGAQNIINNFISGWILMWEKPIRIGDFLEVEEVKGVVEEINTRSTRIRRVDGVHMLIPNSKLLENTVVNWTLVDRLVRSTVRIGVAYGSDPKQVAALIQQATDEQQEVLQDPKPIVTFEDFGDNALIFDVNFWINSSVEGGLRMARSRIRFRISELFEEKNIVIAFPQRDVHIDGAVTITRAPK